MKNFTNDCTPILSLTEENNAIICEVIDSVISEAIVHFNQKRTRRTDDDERYFYKKEEVEAVLAKLNHPEWVKVTIEYDIDGCTPFCYTMDYKVIHKTAAYGKVGRR